MLERLRPARGERDYGWRDDDYAQALAPLPVRASVYGPSGSPSTTANIQTHSLRLRMTPDHGRTWKPHQYLALLFTEHYLARYFDDLETLRADLNREKSLYRQTWFLPDYTRDDLRVMAFQSATGSGKNAAHARACPAIQVLPGTIGWAAQQHCAVDAERADVGTASNGSCMRAGFMPGVLQQSRRQSVPARSRSSI